MSDVLIRCERVSKKFCKSLKKSLWYGLTDTVRDLCVWGVSNDALELRNQTLRTDEFWANQDISFEVKSGECLGLIGRNGAGKTTLLKMLNGLIKPDAGRIELHGRVGALIALGAGFNPILTGRENIHVNASILGLSRRQIADSLDEIVDFAELAEFIDTPVQNYSSGMQVRLGFAIATTIRPDLLIVDEVLAVGDADFKLKCAKRIRRILGNGCSVILVSHNMTDVHNLASAAAWMDHGKLKEIGEPHSVINSYLGYSRTSAKPSEFVWRVTEDAVRGNAVRLLRAAVIAPNGADSITIFSGCLVELDFDCREEGLSLDVTIEVSTIDGIVVFHTGTVISQRGSSEIAEYSVSGVIPGFLLNSGTYVLRVIIGECQSIALVDAVSLLEFTVRNKAKGVNYSELPGVIFPTFQWHVSTRPQKPVEAKAIERRITD